VDAGTLRAWTVAWPTPETSLALRSGLRATMPWPVWLESSRRIQDGLRERKRDALVDLVLAKQPAGAEDPMVPEPRSLGDLGARFLIDVEMGDCRDTSRIVQAAAAVQQMVQRCLLGLEQAIVRNAADATSSGFWRQWEWRQRYRLWEANRTIFLYPEEFMSLSNRSNISPLFRDLEKKVSENEINEGTVAAALESYLVALDKIARLDYRAVDILTDGGTTALGVIASSASNPPTHYYRRMLGGVWDPWEEVSLGPSTTALTLAQGLRRAWVVWPTSTEHLHPVQTIPTSTETVTPDATGKGLTYIRYSWTMRDDRGVWSAPKTTSRAVLMTPRDRRGFVLSAKADDPSPYVFRLILLTRDATAPEADRTVRWTSTMEVVRDATRSYIQPTASFGTTLPADSWGEHFSEYRLSAPDKQSWQLTPWQGLHFDANRMVAGTLVADTALSFCVPVVAAPGQPAVHTPLLSARLPVTVTKPRATMLTSPGQAPRPDAFAINGHLLKDPTAPNQARAASWSCLVFSQPTVTTLVPAEGLAKLGLPAGRFLVVPAYHPFVTELLGRVQEGGLRSIYDATLQESPTAAHLRRQPIELGVGLGADAASTALLSNGKAVIPGPTQPVPEAFDFDALAPYALYNWEVFFFTPLFAAQRLGSVARFREAQAFYHFVFNPLSTEPGETAARFWVTKPLRQAVGDPSIDVILEQAAAGPAPKNDPFKIIADRPFDPHAVAAFRPGAYQKYVVRAYLDNLVAWGDQLYRSGTRQNSREDVDEATVVYELARTILGEPPNEVRPLGEKKVRAFVAPADWLGGGNILVELENTIRGVTEVADDVPLVHLPVLTAGGAPVRSLYFRVPPNRSLLEYWEKVAYRLDNIRSCRSLDGSIVNLPLAGARIDPKALADAAAMGVSVADAISMATARPPPTRFRVTIAKAREACEDVRQLGSALLAALEKRDAEHIARVRSQFEEPILRASRTTRLEQQRHADQEIVALKKSQAMIDAREKFNSERVYMNELEQAAFGLSIAAGVLDAIGAVLDLTSGGLQLIPDVNLGISGVFATPVGTLMYGGSTVASSTTKWAQGLSKLGGLMDRSSAIVGNQAGYARRKEEWDHQAAQARLEREHLAEQVAAAKLRRAILDAEMLGQDAQDAAWRQTDLLLKEKFTSRELYTWHVQRVMDLYRQAYDQATHLAGLARQCLVFETGDSSIPQLDRRDWEATKSGLLAGEGLARYLRDLDTRYLERRPFERVITQHVSLRHVAPVAYASLMTTGNTGSFTIPAWWFKRLYPGVKRRRVRKLSVSIPCVAGPYANVNATVRLLGSSHSISLSSGQNDTGWDASLMTESYAPFEGVNLDVDTEWQVDFPANGTDLDIATVSDVVFHIEYAADEGADPAQPPSELELFLDIARSAPDAWMRLRTGAEHSCTLELDGLVPAFLDGYTPTAVKQATLVDADGATATGAIEAHVVQVDGQASLQVAALPEAAVEWESMRHLVLILRVSMQP
jgi:hypothetical protein